MWSFAEACENICGVWENLPCLPCRLLALSRKCRYSVLWKHERKGVQLHKFPDLLKYYVLEAIGSLYSYQNLSIIFSNPNCWNVATAKTTTSVCMQQIVTSLQPFATECWTWSRILVSASWLHGHRIREYYFMSNIQLQMAVKTWLSVAYTQMW